MALYVIPDRIDLVVEPHELTEEDQKAISEAIRQRKKQKDMSRAEEKIRRILEKRTTTPDPAPCSTT
jgi:hypothetical protein